MATPSTGFNLFDFSSTLNPLSSIIKPQAPVQKTGATGGGLMPPTPSGKPLPQTPQPTIKRGSSFSLIPQASASSEIDETLVEQFIRDGKASGASEQEVKAAFDAAMKDGVFNKSPREGRTISPTPNVTEDSFLEKTAKGLYTPFLEAAGGIRGLSGNLSQALEPIIGPSTILPEEASRTATTNLLKTTKGTSGSVFTGLAPYTATTISAIGATDLGGAALGLLSNAIHAGGKMAIDTIPGLRNLTDEQKNDLTDTVVNTFAAKSAGSIKTSPGNILKKGEPVFEQTIGKKRGTVAKLNTHPGVTLKEIGSGLINFLYETEAGTARAMQKYNAGISPTKPITIGDVAGKYNIAGGTKQMGADAMAVAPKVWKKDIEPLLSRGAEKTTGESLMQNLRADIEKIVEPTQRSAIEKAYRQVYEQYKGKSFTDAELANLKSTLQQKTLNVSETSAARSQILDMLASSGRKTLIDNVKRSTGKDITTPLFEYGALKTLEEMGQKAAESAENIRITGRATASNATFGLVDALSSVITPVKNVAGGFLYRLGNGIEFIGPKGINTVVDIFKNSDKVKIQNPEAIINKKDFGSLKPERLMLEAPKAKYRNPERIVTNPKFPGQTIIEKPVGTRPGTSEITQPKTVILKPGVGRMGTKPEVPLGSGERLLPPKPTEKVLRVNESGKYTLKPKITINKK